MTLNGATQENKRKNYVDFTLGFIGWILINTAIWLVIAFRSPESRYKSWDYYDFGFNLLILPANVIALLVLVIVRRWIAFGALSAIALNLVITWLLGLLMYGACAVPVFVDAIYG